jgi:hypothetical protein
MQKRLSHDFPIVVMTFVLGLVLIGISAPGVMGQGTPIATPVPTCVESVSPVRTPSPTLSELSSRRLDLVLTTDALISCRATADWDAVVALMMPSLLRTQLGTSDPAEAAELMGRLHDGGFLVPFDVQTIGEPTVTGSFGSIDLTTREGFVLRRQEWSFALQNEEWKLSSMVEPSPLLEINAVGTPVTLDAAGLSALRDVLVNPGAIVFEFVNTLDLAASFAVFRIDGTGGSDVHADLLGGIPPDPAAVIGWTESGAGETRTMALVDLPEGTYLIAGGYDPRLPVEPVDESAIVQITIED